MIYPYLNSKNIFVYPYADSYLLYAPLAGGFAVLGKEEVSLIEGQLADGKSNEELGVLLDDGNGEILEIPQWSELSELTVLLNQVCNFSCSYCYSKDGRDKTVLEDSLLIKAIDDFITPQRGSLLSIVFSGGGDPMLSFDVFKKAVLFARRIAEVRGVELEVSAVTNGSALGRDHICFIKDYNVNLVVSCDILQDVHNAQRSHYDIVADTINNLCNEGLYIGLRSTITPLNVCRMNEMVEEIHNRFPKVYGAAFEPVLNKALFPSSEALGEFYSHFIDNIFDAVRLGGQYDIAIGNTIINNVGTNKVRSCLGKIVVTPKGELTACSRLSSPLENHYDDFKYGHVDADIGFVVDSDSYARIINNNVNNNPVCGSCIAKYHCSGGCLLARKSLSEDYMEAYCKFNREMVVKTLLQNSCE